MSKQTIISGIHISHGPDQYEVNFHGISQDWNFLSSMGWNSIGSDQVPKEVKDMANKVWIASKMKLYKKIVKQGSKIVESRRNEPSIPLRDILKILK